MIEEISFNDPIRGACETPEAAREALFHETYLSVMVAVNYA